MALPLAACLTVLLALQASAQPGPKNPAELKAELTRGEHKSLQTDRVILMPGPEDEVRTVNLMYHWFINEGLMESEIGRLNGMQVRLTGPGVDAGTVHEVLTTKSTSATTS
jgi:hypothetical protein